MISRTFSFLFWTNLHLQLKHCIYFSVLNQKKTFWANLFQKIKIKMKRGTYPNSCTLSLMVMFFLMFWIQSWDKFIL